MSRRRARTWYAPRWAGESVPLPAQLGEARQSRLEDRHTFEPHRKRQDFPTSDWQGERKCEQSFLSQIVILGVRCDTYNDHLRGVTGIGIADLLAYGIGIGKEAMREGLIYDGGPNPASRVLRFNFTPHQDGIPSVEKYPGPT